MANALLLNVSYQPLAVVSLRRAVLLVLAEKAEVIEESDEPLRSATFSVAAPKVIRLKRFVKIPYRAKVPLSRKALQYRDGGICQFVHCGKYVGSAGTVDHVVPQSQFHSRKEAHQWENVVWACKACNHKKGAKSLKQLGWSLTKNPTALTTQAWFVVGYSVDPAWEPYLAMC